MKVIHLISGGDSGGAKTHVLSLLQNLNKTITAQLVCFRDGPFAGEARSMGIPTEIMGGNNIPRLRRQLTSYIKAGGYELIHCHGSRANMIGALLRSSTGLPVVSTVHSDYKLDYMGRPLSRLTFGNINAWALRKLDYRIGVSDAMVDLLIQRGFAPDRFYAIYNGECTCQGYGFPVLCTSAQQDFGRAAQPSACHGSVAEVNHHAWIVVTSLHEGFQG